MKKLVVCLLVMSASMITGCNKTSVIGNYGPMPENYATVGNSSSKDDGKPIEITFHVGHDASECNSSCIVLNGVPTHADCQGWGNACAITIRIWPIGGQPKSTTFSALVDTVWSMTSEDFFMMPARSLAMIGSEGAATTYLNIPQQLLFRDNTTHQFTFTGLFFSSTAAYSNN